MTVWQNRVAHVSSGMAMKSIVGIFGEPQEKSTIRTNEIQWLRGVSEDELARLKRDNLVFVVFRYMKRFTPISSMSSEISIFFDEKGGKTVGPPQTPFFDEWAGSHLAKTEYIFFTSVALAFFAWFGLRLLCRKQAKALDNRSASGGFSGSEGER